jgi:hypothetical protein
MCPLVGAAGAVVVQRPFFMGSAVIILKLSTSMFLVLSLTACCCVNGDKAATLDGGTTHLPTAVADIAKPSASAEIKGFVLSDPWFREVYEGISLDQFHNAHPSVELELDKDQSLPRTGLKVFNDRSSFSYSFIDDRLVQSSFILLRSEQSSSEEIARYERNLGAAHDTVVPDRALGKSVRRYRKWLLSDLDLEVELIEGKDANDGTIVRSGHVLAVGRRDRFVDRLNSGK